jgi:hypothetical protein
MKKTSFPLLLLCLLPLAAQTRVVPDCAISFNLINANDATSQDSCGHQTGTGIVDWILVYAVSGFKTATLAVQSAPDAGGTPGTWDTFAGVVSIGSNPSTSGTSGYVQLSGYNPWNRVQFTDFTCGSIQVAAQPICTGAVKGSLYGFLRPGEDRLARTPTIRDLSKIREKRQFMILFAYEKAPPASSFAALWSIRPDHARRP